MKGKVQVCLFALVITSVVSCASGGLSNFGADIGKKSTPVGTVRVPYLYSQKYFGYIQPGQEPDAVVEGRKTYYVYIWVPIVTPEIGVRMMSPVGSIAPGDDDLVSKTFTENSDDEASYFDTWVQLERAESVINPEDIKRGVSGSWFKYASNDDSGEMPANPSGRKYNSLLRVVADASTPLARGLYRVALTTYKRGEVKGSFLAEIGSTVELPGLVMSNNIDDLMKKIKEAAQ